MVAERAGQTGHQPDAQREASRLGAPEARPRATGSGGRRCRPATRRTDRRIPAQLEPEARGGRRSTRSWLPVGTPSRAAGSSPARALASPSATRSAQRFSPLLPPAGPARAARAHTAGRLPRRRAARWRDLRRAAHTRPPAGISARQRFEEVVCKLREVRLRIGCVEVLEDLPGPQVRALRRPALSASYSVSRTSAWEKRSRPTVGASASTRAVIASSSASRAAILVEFCHGGKLPDPELAAQGRSSLEQSPTVRSSAAATVADHLSDGVRKLARHAEAHPAAARACPPPPAAARSRPRTADCPRSRRGSRRATVSATWRPVIASIMAAVSATVRPVKRIRRVVCSRARDARHVLSAPFSPGSSSR